MSTSDQSAFNFATQQTRRPKKPERLFLGVFPDELAKRKANRVSQRIADEAGLVGSSLPANRFHTSLIHLSDRKRVRSSDQFAAELAARMIRIPPFDITYSRLGSFPGVPKKGRPLEHPLVLLADEGPVTALYAALATELRKFRFRVPDHFRPHLTLSYNRQFLPTRAIEPITFVVNEFVLVHSMLWLKRYRILRTWTLH